MINELYPMKSPISHLLVRALDSHASISGFFHQFIFFWGLHPAATKWNSLKPIHLHVVGPIGKTFKRKNKIIKNWC